MNEKLFLHYGPGANAYVERKLLNTTAVCFWDQPRFQTSTSPFSALTEASAQKASNLKSQTLIGHSFGCDLIGNMIQKKLFSAREVILISPLQSIPKAMANMAERISQNQPAPELEKALQEFKQSSSTTPQLFWNLVSQVAPSPLYPVLLWQSESARKTFEKLSAEGPGFDPAEWQAVINDYLFGNIAGNVFNFKTEKIKVYFGENDPYLRADDFDHWRKQVGAENVVVVKNAGHYPHLENPGAVPL